MALKAGQHGRIVKMARALELPTPRLDREVERYTLTPDQLERLMMLAAMSHNVFELQAEPEDEDGRYGH